MKRMYKKTIRSSGMRTIAMYLPQFHRTKENDEWWGKGFTEWTAVKNAKPLFKGHDQPRIPKDNNYYNLLNKSTMQFQAELMHKYGIDGMCFYHYFFKDGKMVLNEPAENLLAWKDVDMPFCFDWANESWVRTWSNIRGNTWSELSEKKDDTGRSILLEQKYGREELWKAHFDYFLPFFLDKRYIHIDGRPLLLIHRAAEIPCLYPMIKYWKRLSEENKINSPYIITVNDELTIPGTDAVVFLQPHYSKWIDGFLSYDCDSLWNDMKEQKRYKGQKKYLSAVVDFDSTPRRGRNGVIQRGFSVDKFEKGMISLYEKSEAWKNEFVFINAWNEWGEGMYLEPDERYGYGCLEAIKSAKEKCSCTDQQDRYIFEVDKNKLKLIRNRKYINCLDSWLRLKENNKSISKMLEKNKIESIAIYGYGMLGRHLLKDINYSKVRVDCIIDRQKEYPNLQVPVFDLNDELPKVEAVVVTVIGDYEEIYDQLMIKMPQSKIFSVYELIYEAE